MNGDNLGNGKNLLYPGRVTVGRDRCRHLCYGRGCCYGRGKSGRKKVGPTKDTVPVKVSFITNVLKTFLNFIDLLTFYLNFGCDCSAQNFKCIDSQTGFFNQMNLALDRALKGSKNLSAIFSPRHGIFLGLRCALYDDFVGSA